jgi:hypothetical protein
MIVDVLLALAWLVIVLTPAVLAACQPVVSDDGYNHFKPDDLMLPQPVPARARNSVHARKR